MVDKYWLWDFESAAVCPISTSCVIFITRFYGKGERKR